MAHDTVVPHPPETVQTAHIADPPAMLMKNTSFAHACVNTDQTELSSRSVSTSHVDELLKELTRLREENEILRRQVSLNQGQQSSVEFISVGTQCPAVRVLQFRCYLLSFG